MSEDGMWARLRPLMRGLDPQRIENKLDKGVPDVNYIHGWIELKQIADWPVRDTTIVDVDVRTEQRVWLNRRSHMNGRVFLLLHVVAPDQWLLFEGRVAAAMVGKTLRRHLNAVAIFNCTGTPGEKFIQAIA